MIKNKKHFCKIFYFFVFIGLYNMGLALVALPLLLPNFLLDVLLKHMYVSQKSDSIVVIHLICLWIQVVCLAVRGSPRLKPLDTIEVLFKLVLVSKVVAVVDVVDNVSIEIMLVCVSVGTRPRVDFLLFLFEFFKTRKRDINHRKSCKCLSITHNDEFFVSVCLSVC